MATMNETAKKIALILVEDKAICRDLNLIFDTVKSYLTFGLAESVNDVQQTTTTVNK